MKQFIHHEWGLFVNGNGNPGDLKYCVVICEEGSYCVYENGEVKRMGDKNHWESGPKVWKEISPENFYFKEHLHKIPGFNKTINQCNCKMTILLRYGCQCGGI